MKRKIVEEGIMLRSSALSSGTILGSLAFILTGMPAIAADSDVDTKQLLNLSLEQLSNIEVTSVSKTPEKASEAAAAIYVITQDDIHRSGATDIPDLLRQVPGLNVAQSGSHEWAVSSRGSNDEFANKLLVLIDGRTVYTPLFSGVFWDTQDVPLQDIDRIEVIRGPGATLWGANAVNGVINIITKSAQDTQGGFASETAGNLDNSLTTVRYGAKIADNAYARIYAKYDDYNDVNKLNGTSNQDPWNKAQTGFRSDWKIDDNQSFTLQGDMYHAGEDTLIHLPLADATYNTFADRDNDIGGNLLGRWDNKLSQDSDLTLQMYYDDASRSNTFYGAKIQTFDFDIQHVWTGFTRQEIVWGAGYRLIDSSTTPTPYITFTPLHRNDSLYSSFVQDKLAIVPDKFFLTLGSKFEHNAFTGFEYEPSARASWLIDDKQTLWGSVSRAVRTPNLATNDMQIIIAPISANFLATQEGANTLSEELLAYELGYRIQPVKNVSLDIAAFYNDYNRLLVGQLGAVSGPITNSIGTCFIDPAIPVNVGKAHSYGIETSAKWDPTTYMQLAAGYSLLELKFDQPDPYGRSFANSSPKNQFNLRSDIRMPHNVSFDTSLYYVDSIDPVGPSGGPEHIAAYARLDTKLTWQAMDNLELSLVGQNLLQSEHREFTGFLYQSDSQIPRSFYGNITWKF